MREDNARLLTAAEVAERLGFTERYVWKLGREGVLPRVKLPGRKYVRFAERDVEQFISDSRGFGCRSRRSVTPVTSVTSVTPRRF